MPWLWITISLFAFVLMLQWASIQVLTPKLVREHFDLGVGAYGLLFSLIGGGMIVGSFLVGQLNPQRRRGVISYLIWIANSVLVIVFALSPWYPLAAAAAFVRGICIGFGVTIWETMLMELVPRHMLSRVVSLDWFGSLGLTPFGLLFVGAISDSPRRVTIIALAAAISIGVIALGPDSPSRSGRSTDARLLEAEVRHALLAPPRLVAPAGQAGSRRSSASPRRHSASACGSSSGARCTELTKAQARRIAVRAQLLDAPRPTDLLEVVQRLTLLQIDPTAAIAPSADLVLWSRLGSSYRPDDLKHALEEERSLFELDALIRPTSDLGLYLAGADERPSYERTRVWLKDNDRFRRDILERLRELGPTELARAARTPPQCRGPRAAGRTTATSPRCWRS